MLRIRKDDMVVVVAGKDKGKRGKVLNIQTAESRVVVENVNLVKKARRKTQQDQKGGIIDIESPLHISNVMLYCKPCDKPRRFRVNVLKDGTKIRECKKCSSAAPIIK